MAWPLHSAVFEAVDFGGEARSAVQFGLSVDVDVVVRDCSSLIALLRNKLASVVLTATFYQMSTSAGMVVADNNSRQAEEDDAELATSIFVKYNGLLHGERKTRHSKNEKLTVKFLKKYIHYSKSRHQPVLTDKASEHIASTYAEMRNAGAEAKFGGATLPIIARSLETVIRLSTTHAKVKLRNQSLAQRLPGTLYELVGPQPYNVRLHAGVNSKNLPVSSLWPNYIHPYVQRKETLPILS